MAVARCCRGRVRTAGSGPSDAELSRKPNASTVGRGFGSGVFTLLVDETPWPTVAGLVVGGLFAAPLAALLTRHLHTRALLMLVGSVIVGISGFNLWRALA